MPNKNPPKNAPIKKDKQASKKSTPPAGILIAAMPVKKGKKA